MAWYALQVRSNMEAVVESTLRQRQVDAFFPFYEKQDRRKRIFHRPFFPGYVLADFELDRKFPVISVPQVVRIVGSGSDPIPLSDLEVASVRRISEVAALVSAAPSEYYSEGQEVVVLQGPLAGAQGRVAYVKNRTRLVVSIEMLRRSISAEVDASWLRVVGQSAPMVAASN